MQPDNCPNCNAEIKNGILKQNLIVKEKEINSINILLEIDNPSYCDKCAAELRRKITVRFDEYQRFINSHIHNVPVITTHTPYNWNYKPIGIVTGQSVTGTGVISEMTSSFTDFFGGQSGSFVKKIASGEQMCLGQLRIKTLQLGGHAVIATDIDYAELGSIKGMIMVCAAGTAISLNDISVLGETQEIIKQLSVKSKWIKLYYDNPD